MQQTIFSSRYFNDRIRIYNIDSVPDLANKKQLINRWITAIESGNLSFSKETQIDITFLNDIFGEVLDYEYEIDKQKINLIPKSSIDSKEPDAILGFFTQQNRKDIRAVIELKDSKNDLDRIQNRLEKISPVTQAFEYARKAGENCKWVIVSNIQTIRLYNKESDRYEIFNLMDLNDDFHLKRFFFLLHKDRLFFQSGESYVDILYRERLEEETKIEKEFYANYHSLRTKLFEHIIANNNIEPAISLEKTQKLLDRIIFVCFCADLNIIPKSILQEVIKTANPSFKFTNDFLWTTLKQLFYTLDLGNNLITKLNGGLFEEDLILNNLKISDSILLDILKLSDYDYRSDLNVNILGHIFEQSISDIERMKQNLLKYNNLAGLNGEQNGKRKAFGIFYTPENITKFLVNQTIGNWLEEQKLELGENELPILTDKDYDLIKITKQGTLRTNEHIEKNKLFWSNYLDRLLSIKILDPACGSGAFLVECLNFLITEYRNVQKELRLLNPPIPPVEYKSKLKQELTLNLEKPEFEIEEHILRHNLYGVDINFESVEITKLALWLKTVKKGKVLADIDFNIQQGNSLIADSDVAGNLAFNWKLKFEKIMKDGGFDVIIGNPPYGATFTEDEISYIANNYKSFEYQTNSYVSFYEKGLKLLKSNGFLGYITPNTFTYQYYFKNIRKIINENHIYCACKNQYKVFEDAEIGDTISFVIKKAPFDEKFTIYTKKCLNSDDLNNKEFQLSTLSNFVKSDGTYILNGNKDFDFEKIYKDTTPLGELAQIIVGIKAYQCGKGVPQQTEQIVVQKIFTADNQVSEGYIRCINGKDFHRYHFLQIPKMFLKYGEWLAEPRTSAPFFDNEKIIIRQTSDSLICHIDTNKWINLNNVYNIGRCQENISLRYILALLNSKLFAFIYQSIAQEKGKLFAEVKKVYLEKLPIKIIPFDEQQIFICLVNELIENNSVIEKLKAKLINRISSNYNIQKVSNNLANFNNLSFAELNNELKKIKIELNFKQQDELEEYFTVNKNQINSMIELRKSLDKQIDNLVFKLYDLTDSDIELIE